MFFVIVQGTGYFHQASQAKVGFPDLWAWVSPLGPDGVFDAMSHAVM